MTPTIKDKNMNDSSLNDTSITQTLENIRTMQQSYDALASSVVTAPIVNELESGKAAIIAAINAMGGTATESMSMGELAQAIRDLILVQLGELEFDVSVASAQDAANKLQDHCTKYVDDFTTIMDTPLIVDEWQALEEVRYKRLLDYNFTQFSSDERKTNVYGITNCHNLRKLVFDALRTISLTDGSSQFIHGNMIMLNEVDMPNLTSIISSSSLDNGNMILVGLTALTSLNIPKLQSISMTAGRQQQGRILAELSALETLSLPELKSITFNSGDNATIYYDILSGLSSLTTLDLSSLETISSRATANNAKIFTNLSSLSELYLPSLKTITVTAGTTAGTYTIFGGLSSLVKLSAPSITGITHQGNGYSNIFQGATNLIDIEIGHTDDFGVGSIVSNMRLNGINPTNVYGDAEKLATLNESIRTKWFANLYDYTGGTAHTLTLASALVSHLEAETIAAATTKNWTIATI